MTCTAAALATLARAPLHRAPRTPPTTRTAAALATLLIALPAGTALAHGTKKDGHEEETAEVVREQKPWGIAASADEADRTIEVAMSDAMRFTPESISVEEGETVRFVVANEGETMHEFVLGTESSNDEHAELMLKFPGMEHDEPYMAHVAPGETGEIVWTFNRSGEFAFACLIAGHYQAGMVGDITVGDG